VKIENSDGLVIVGGTFCHGEHREEVVCGCWEGFGRLAGKNFGRVRAADLKIGHYKGLWQT
jgi:hypothetical protein